MSFTDGDQEKTRQELEGKTQTEGKSAVGEISCITAATLASLRKHGGI